MRTNTTDGAGNIIVTLSASEISSEAAQALLAQIASGHKVALLGGEDLINTPLQNLLPQMAFGSELPAAVAISADLISQLSDAARETAQSQAGAAIAAAMKHGYAIEILSQEATAISHTNRSELIKGAIAQLNIEDFYPNHPWASHQEESLAACYHTLAALFMRLGDMEAAEDCLLQSEQFEDSPRALAMKALLSRLQGQTLGAVANMVSSLQQYEQRKQDNGSHYLAFKPGDIEVINFKLREGLEALNKRDNEAALNKFTEAVFNFDSFYSDMGLDKLN